MIQDQFCWVGKMDLNWCYGKPDRSPTTDSGLVGLGGGPDGPEGWGYVVKHSLKQREGVGSKRVPGSVRDHRPRETTFF